MNQIHLNLNTMRELKWWFISLTHIVLFQHLLVHTKVLLILSQLLVQLLKGKENLKYYNNLHSQIIYWYCNPPESNTWLLNSCAHQIISVGHRVLESCLVALDLWPHGAELRLLPPLLHPLLQLLGQLLLPVLQLPQLFLIPTSGLGPQITGKGSNSPYNTGSQFCINLTTISINSYFKQIGLCSFIFFPSKIHHNYKRQISYLAPPEITPDFWKRVPSRATDWKKDNVVTVNIISIRRKTISINCSWFIKNFKTLHMCNINVRWERYSHLFKPEKVSTWTIKNQAFK